VIYGIPQSVMSKSRRDGSCIGYGQVEESFKRVLYALSAEQQENICFQKCKKSLLKATGNSTFNLEGDLACLS